MFNETSRFDNFTKLLFSKMYLKFLSRPFRPNCFQLLKGKIFELKISKHFFSKFESYEIGHFTSQHKNVCTFMKTLRNFFASKALTQNPANNLTMFQIPKFNFKKSLVLISILWYPKYIDIWLTPFGPPCGAIQGAILRVP